MVILLASEFGCSIELCDISDSLSIPPGTFAFKPPAIRGKPAFSSRGAPAGHAALSRFLSIVLEMPEKEY